MSVSPAPGTRPVPNVFAGGSCYRGCSCHYVCEVLRSLFLTKWHDSQTGGGVGGGRVRAGWISLSREAPCEEGLGVSQRMGSQAST